MSYEQCHTLSQIFFSLSCATCKYYIFCVIHSVRGKRDKTCESYNKFSKALTEKFYGKFPYSDYEWSKYIKPQNSE